MSCFKIDIANQVFEVNAIHVRSGALCHRFITDGEANCRVTVLPEDIERERELYKELYEDCIDPWDGFIEFSLLYRKIAESLIDYDTFALHGAAIALDNNAYLFTAPSGTGKTTHILKWLKNRPDSYVVNGDKPFIIAGFKNEQPLICGSPWAGKENLYTNTIVPLKAIVIMQRDENNRIEQIPFSKAFISLLQQAYRPKDPLKMRKTLKLLKSLENRVPFYSFQVNNFQEDAFQTAYYALCK